MVRRPVDAHAVIVAVRPHRVRAEEARLEVDRIWRLGSVGSFVCKPVRIIREVNFPTVPDHCEARERRRDANQAPTYSREETSGPVRRVPSELGPPNGHGDRSEGETPSRGRIL